LLGTVWHGGDLVFLDITADGLAVRELAPDVSVGDVRNHTAAPLLIAAT
jgi:acyl CoA:acetate/3-ketoacid CoA transferase beta subunit